MSNEEFVRCTNCGNLNIKGTALCIFCDTDLSDAPISEEEPSPEALESAPSVPKADVPDVKEVAEKQVEDTIPIPKIPGVDDLETKEEKKPKKEKAPEEEDVKIKVDRTQKSFGTKLLFITLFGFLISIGHYALNLLTAYVSIDINDPNIHVPPIPGNLSSLVNINALSVVLGVFFAVVMGYLLGKIIHIYSTKKSAIIKWAIYIIFLDVVVNCGLAIGLIAITNAFGVLHDILYVFLAGSFIIFALVSLVSLFIPMISGSFLLYNQIDKIFFPRKYKA